MDERFIAVDTGSKGDKISIVKGRFKDGCMYIDEIKTIDKEVEQLNRRFPNG